MSNFSSKKDQKLAKKARREEDYGATDSESKITTPSKKKCTKTPEGKQVSRHGKQRAEVKPQEAPLPIILPLTRKQSREAANLKHLEEEAAATKKVLLKVKEPTDCVKEKKVAATEKVQLQVNEPTHHRKEKKVAATEKVQLKIKEPTNELEEQVAAAPEQVQLQVNEPTNELEGQETAAPEQVLEKISSILPIQNRRKKRVSQRRPEAEQAGSLNTEQEAEPTKAKDAPLPTTSTWKLVPRYCSPEFVEQAAEQQEEKEAAAPEQVQLKVPEPTKDLKEKVEDSTSQLLFRKENPFPRIQVELLENKAKPNEALLKYSWFKDFEKLLENPISDVRRKKCIYLPPDFNSPKKRNNPTYLREQCLQKTILPSQSWREHPKQVVQRAPEGEHAGRLATEQEAEPIKRKDAPLPTTSTWKLLPRCIMLQQLPAKRQKEKETAAPKQLQLKVPEPMKDLKEKVEDSTSQLVFRKENSFPRIQVELLENKSKPNEALLKYSWFKDFEKLLENPISDVRRKKCIYLPPDFNSPKKRNNPTDLREQCMQKKILPSQSWREHPKQVVQRAPEGEHAGRLATEQKAEPSKPKVEDSTSQLVFRKDNAILQVQVEVLEKKAKLSEVLRKESGIKMCEKLSELELQLSLRKVTESENGHKLKQLEEALQVQKEANRETVTNLFQTLQLRKKSQEDVAMHLAQQRETSDQLQAALTESLAESNRQQLQRQEERNHLLQAIDTMKCTLEETRVVQRPERLSLGRRILRFFRRPGGQETRVLDPSQQVGNKLVNGAFVLHCSRNALSHFDLDKFCSSTHWMGAASPPSIPATMHTSNSPKTESLPH
ncbi:hypothetical protein EYF80_025093 [Liparis tanakae]|uniref:Uncharacterized protein n=1 Tax=Liparis tanakae TaxID=230148 RepID=A0A4Z2HG33_9TELE|nr:hypothetical protein EYF80_025093 [Liparis tanakae]